MDRDCTLFNKASTVRYKNRAKPSWWSFLSKRYALTCEAWPGSMCFWIQCNCMVLLNKVVEVSATLYYAFVMNLAENFHSRFWCFVSFLWISYHRECLEL